MSYDDWKAKIREYYATHPEQAKKWLENNRERFREYQKEYYKTYNKEHAEEIRERNQKYRAEHIDEMRERSRKYYAENAEEIRKKSGEKIQCPFCKSNVRRDGLKEHQQTKKCKSTQV